MFWLASLATAAGPVLFFVQREGIDAVLAPSHDRYLQALQQALWPTRVLGSVPIFLFFPKWRWVLCAALFVSTLVLVLIDVSSALLVSSAGASIVLPVLLYALATSVSIRHARSPAVA